MTTVITVMSNLSLVHFPTTSCHNGYALCSRIDPNGRSIPPPLDQQANLMRPGHHIQRGPNWHYGDEDGGPGSVGEVLNWNTGVDYLFWVHWPNGNNRIYVMQAGRGRNLGTFDVMFSQAQVENLGDCWDTEGNMCAEGDQCGDINSGNCSYKYCHDADHYDCFCANQNTNETYSTCCELDGQIYPPGRYNDFCAPLQCAGFWFWQGYINNNCKKCKAYMDPHVNTFDQSYRNYGYQGCGEYSMAQQGVSYDPEFGVFASFDEYCGNGVSCVNTATLKQDGIEVIAKSRRTDYTTYVTVNGIDYNLSDFDVNVLPVFVPVDGNDKVMAWKHHYDQRSHYNCVFFQGTKGLLLQFCGSYTNLMHVWAMPELSGQVNGLCGTLTDDVTDDYMTRQGVIMDYDTVLESSSSFPYTSDLVDDWATAWLTDPTSSTSCSSAGRRKRNIERMEDCIDIALYAAQCNNTVSRIASHLSNDEIHELITDCTFDLCHVDDPDTYLNDTVSESVKIQDDVEKVTINISSPDGCGENFENIGGECFKRISNLTTDWEDAKSLCEVQGLYLAEPWDIKAVALYLKENYDDLFYWLGGRGDGEVARWVSGGKVSSKEPWSKHTYGSISGNADRCLDILTYGNWPARGEMLASGLCSGRIPRAALCSLIQRPAE